MNTQYVDLLYFVLVGLGTKIAPKTTLLGNYPQLYLLLQQVLLQSIPLAYVYTSVLTKNNSSGMFKHALYLHQLIHTCVLTYRTS